MANKLLNIEQMSNEQTHLTWFAFQCNIFHLISLDSKIHECYWYITLPSLQTEVEGIQHSSLSPLGFGCPLKHAVIDNCYKLGRAWLLLAELCFLPRNITLHHVAWKALFFSRWPSPTPLPPPSICPFVHNDRGWTVSVPQKQEVPVLLHVRRLIQLVQLVWFGVDVILRGVALRSSY